MGKERKLIDAYRKFTGKDVNQVSPQWKVWVKKFDWKGRAEVYDEWNLSIATKAVAVSIEKKGVFGITEYFNAVENAIARDPLIEKNLTDLLENYILGLLEKKQKGDIVTGNEIRTAAEIRRLINTGRKENHAQAGDLLGFRTIEENDARAVS